MKSIGELLSTTCLRKPRRKVCAFSLAKAPQVCGPPTRAFGSARFTARALTSYMSQNCGIVPSQ